MTKTIFVLGMGLFLMATSVGCGGHGSSDSSSNANADSKTGPSGYHDTYSKISHTLITIKDFQIRTEEGDIIKVTTDEMNVDLQMLSAFAQGLNLDLTNVDFPSGATSINVAEIQTTVVKKDSNEIQFTDGTDCALKEVPKTLNLYTAASIAMTHTAYHVKVGYTALNSIQLDIETKTEQVCQPDPNDKKANRAAADCKQICTSQTTTKQVCKLVNRRQPLTGAPTAADDNF